MSFAKISIIGNLGADPELKYTADGKPRLEMRVATNERRKAAGGDWEDKTTWYRVIMFGERSVKLAEWLRKGRKVYAEGRLQVDLYDSKEGRSALRSTSSQARSSSSIEIQTLIRTRHGRLDRLHRARALQKRAASRRQAILTIYRSNPNHSELRGAHHA